MSLPRMRIGASLVLAAGLLAACTSSNAVTFNNLIVEKQQAIATKMNALADAVTKDKPEELQKQLDELNALTDSSIKEVQALPQMDKGEEFKAAAVKSFTFYKTTSASMVAIINGGDDWSKKAMDLTTLLAQVQKDSDASDKDVLAAQKAFADANGIRIQE